MVHITHLRTWRNRAPLAEWCQLSLSSLPFKNCGGSMFADATVSSIDRVQRILHTHDALISSYNCSFKFNKGSTSRDWYTIDVVLTKQNDWTNSIALRRVLWTLLSSPHHLFSLLIHIYQQFIPRRGYEYTIVIATPITFTAFCVTSHQTMPKYKRWNIYIKMSI